MAILSLKKVLKRGRYSGDQEMLNEHVILLYCAYILFMYTFCTHIMLATVDPETPKNMGSCKVTLSLIH